MVVGDGGLGTNGDPRVIVYVWRSSAVSASFRLRAGGTCTRYYYGKALVDNGFFGP